MTALTIESYGSDTVPFLHMALNRPGSLYTSQPPVSQNTPSLEHPLSEKKATMLCKCKPRGEATYYDQIDSPN